MTGMKMEVGTDRRQPYLKGLPIGYRFLPTDEELVSHYLINKVLCRPLPVPIGREIKASELFSQAPNKLVAFECEEREWYFFIHEDEDFNIRVVKNGDGFWRKSKTVKPIQILEGEVSVQKFELIYFSGNMSNPRKTHWKMDVYRLSNHGGCCSASTNVQGAEWVLGKLKRGKGYDAFF